MGEVIRFNSKPWAADPERAEAIEQLHADLDNAIAYRDRMREPPTSREIAIRAMDRLWRGNHAYGLFVLVLVAMTIAFIWFPWSNFPIFLVPLLVIGPLFLLAFARERIHGEQSQRAWRERQATEADESIAAIRERLIEQGAMTEAELVPLRRLGDGPGARRGL